MSILLADPNQPGVAFGAHAADSWPHAPDPAIQAPRDTPAAPAPAALRKYFALR